MRHESTLSDLFGDDDLNDDDSNKCGEGQAQVTFIRYVKFGGELQQIQKDSTMDVGLNNITPNLYVE